MKKILFMALFCALLVANVVSAQKKNQLEGVWKVAEVKISSKDSTTTITTPQPGLVIFTKGYYSIVAVRDNKPRVAVEEAKNPQQLTDAEKIARFDSWRLVTANSGTYEVKDGRISRHPMVAKNVDMMTRQTPLTEEVKFEGANTVWLHAIDTAATQLRVRLTRVE